MKIMDKIDGGSRASKSVGLATVVILLAIIQIYGAVSARDFLWKFLAIEDEMVRNIVRTVLEYLIFSVMYGAIYCAVDYFYRLFWIHQNREIYIRGKWLHIHKKDQIRIGVVDIKQEFNVIAASAENIAPPSEGSGSFKNQITRWRYLIAQVRSDGSTMREMIGFYTAVKKDSNLATDGMHMLNIDGNKRYPTQMDGFFSDTFRATETQIDPSSRRGQLYMFRMSKKLEKYLYGPNGLDYKKLASLHENEQFCNEPYVMELKAALAERG